MIIRLAAAAGLALILSALLLASFDYAASGIAALLVMGTGTLGLLCGFVSRMRRGTWVSPWGAALVASSIAACIVYGVTVRMQRRESFRRGDAIVAALDAYRTSRGGYPRALGDLTPQYLEAVPDSAMGVLSPVPFRYAATGREEFTLVFPAPSFLSCSRTRATAWACRD